MSSQRDTAGLIPGKEETIVWTVYHVVIAVLSLFGDTIILVGTTKFKAIKLHRVIVVVIQHLAAADLILTFTRVVPIIVSLIGGGWVLGTFLCSINFGLAYVVTPTISLLTCVLSTSKLIIVQYPLRAGTWSSKRGHIVCLAIWISTFLLPTQMIHMIFTTEKSLYFDYIHYNCFVDHNLLNIPIWLNYFQHIAIVVIFLTKVSLMISTSVILLYKAHKAAGSRGGSLRWQGVLPVTLTTGVYLVSYIPDVIMTALVHYHYKYVGGPSITAQRAVSFLENINIVANFFIYCLTVSSFREFLAAKIRGIAQQVGLSEPAAARSVRVHRGANSSGASSSGAKGRGAKGSGAKGSGAKGSGAKGSGAKGSDRSRGGAGVRGSGRESSTWVTDETTF